MKDITEIKALIERFFEGETTLEEEQWLYDYFKQTKDLPGELETYREMFLGFDAIALNDTASPVINKVENEVPLTAREISVSPTPPKYRSLWKHPHLVRPCLLLKMHQYCYHTNIWNGHKDPPLYAPLNMLPTIGRFLCP